MLSRVSYAAKICDAGFAEYDFNSATTACYNLWLYDLCDVYLVRIEYFFIQSIATKDFYQFILN